MHVFYETLFYFFYYAKQCFDILYVFSIDIFGAAFLQGCGSGWVFGVAFCGVADPAGFLGQPICRVVLWIRLGFWGGFSAGL